MQKNTLGKTSIQVSKLCFGTLTIGPLQKNLSIQGGSQLLLYAFQKGINFIDTAELYETYIYIKEALKNWNREKIVIATKSYAHTKETAEQSLKNALKEMGTDYIDIFLLHEQENQHTIRGHYEALEYYIKMKEKGYIKSVGISTHNIDAVKASLKYNEIEIIHPIVNQTGLGIQDGTIQEMLISLEKAYMQGKGIYAMKPLGGGNLLKNFQECFDFVLKIPYIHSVAVGMQSIDEIDINCAIFSNQKIESKLIEKINQKTRKLNIAFWCESCGKCLKGCKQNALNIIDNKLIIKHEKCILCGYCAKYCPQFCIKII